MTKRLPTHEKLLREAKRLSKKVNSRLRELEKNYPDSTWAETILRGKLQNKKGLTPTGKVRASKKMTEAQLRNSIKAQKEFLKDKRSTVKGLEATKRKLEREIKKSLKEDLNITIQEADNLVQLFKEEAFNNLTRYIPPSELWVMINQARKQVTVVNGQKKQGITNQKDFIDLFRKQYDFSENRGIVTALKEFYSKVYRTIR